MSQKIISPSTSVNSTAHPGSTGYDYTIGPQQTLPELPVSSSTTGGGIGGGASTAVSTTLPLPSVYNESLNPNARNQHVSLSAYAFLFQELVSQARNASKSVSEIELRLHRSGYHIGIRLLELLNFRSSVSAGFGSSSSSKAFFSKTAMNPSGNALALNGSLSSTQDEPSLAQGISHMKRRDLKPVEILQFIHSTVWSYLFGRVSDDLVKSSERENEFMLIDSAPMLTQFISSTNVQCDFFVCGIIEGILDSASFPCNVTVHSVPEPNFEQKVVFVVKFEPQVLEREALRA
ncbi:LAME_0H10792g1_1 [Lachancea meyersii CBS 8951]|uniref:LAME_0H10792g1_1 n=1 Tax=Lachancea meyersii CBS 8951 TaxID=1266667 RepID=A0A1G4KGF2_9SACH|nr:LAME_0H10792g1_1 [Lachancea meyersii CBS 8951]